MLPAVGRRRRPAAGRADRGQGGGAAVRPVPRRPAARASTRCSGRRCARPARSWASTSSSAPRSPSRRPPPTASLPVKGRAFVSVASKDKRAMIFPVKRLADLGFEIWATSGTGEVLRRNGVRATIVRKHSEGRGPDGEPTIVERILAGQVDLVVNTPFGSPGQSGPAPGRLRDPHRGGPPRPPVRHHGGRARRDRAGHRGHHEERGGRAVASGARRADQRGWPAGRHDGQRTPSPSPARCRSAARC